MKKRKNKTNKLLLFLGILIGILSLFGLSYAIWLLSLKQTNPNLVKSSCLKLSLTNEKNDIFIEKAYPLLNEEGKKLTPYEFTIENTCDLFVSYSVNLEVLDETTLPIKYVSVLLNEEGVQRLSNFDTVESTLKNISIAKELYKGGIGAGEVNDYKLRLWLSEDVGPEDTDAMNKIFTSKVTVTASAGIYDPLKQGYDTISDAILANEYQTSPAISKQKIVSKQMPDFSKTAPISVWKPNIDTSESTKVVVMPHPDLVSLSSTDERFKNLDKEKVLLPIGTSYSIDSATGRYSIENVSQLDPTKLIYNNGTTYYYCTAGYSTDTNDIISIWKTTSNCMNIFQITSATFNDDIVTGSGGSTFQVRKYNLNGYTMNQIETESDKSDKGLYQMEDDNGISYYYRGSVNNNYVKFAGFYWRIIRINGDNSVRLLYSGTSADATGAELFNNSKNKFNAERNNPAYNGYMFGSTLNESYEKTTANEVDSNIKSVLDNWYKDNIKGTNNESIIVDAGFCGDRSITTGLGYSDSENVSYSSQDRYIKTKEPTFKCQEENDLFTLSTNILGNKALTYPIGLITVDELMASGIADGYINRLNYVYSSYAYWTMSPRSYNGSIKVANNFFMSPLGYLGSNWVTDNYGVRAVINIKGNSKISGGVGTSSNPYQIDIT